LGQNLILIYFFNLTKIDISIIVPVFNVEKYLVKCLDSIFDQNFSNSFEVIAVEDCSTDNSLEVLREYKLKQPNLIIVEHTENKRLAGARSSGMKIAHGKYLMHVDSDDVLLPNALDELWKYCKKTNADIVAFNYLVENEKGILFNRKKIKREIITNDKIKIQKHFFGRCWNKIVKKSLTNQMIYSTSQHPRSTEDLIYCTEILLRANKVCLIPQTYYKYFIHSNSITQKSNPSKYLSNQIIIIDNLSKICNYYKPSSQFKEALLRYFSKFLYLSIAKAHFYSNNLIPLCQNYLNEIIKNPLLDSNKGIKINRALKNKYYSLYEIFNFFNLKLVIGIIFRSFFKK
jgi:glycosyltransferase EpsH